MQNNKFSDELLWQSLPDGATVMYAFFNEDRSRRILVYRNMMEIAQTK